MPNKDKELTTERLTQYIDNAKLIITTLATVTLESYWKLGQLLHGLDKNYGSSAVKEFSRRLTEETGKEYSESSLYRMRQFFERTPEERLKELISSGIRWSHIVHTLSADPEIVDEVVDKVVANELPPDKLVDTVKTAVAGDGVPSGLDETPPPEAEEDKLGNPASAVKQITRTIGILSNAIETMGDVLIVVDKFKNMPEEDKKSLVKPLNELREVFANLAACGGPVFEKLKETLD